jgi:hypothetical protein
MFQHVQLYKYMALVLEFSADVRAHVVGKPEKECTLTIQCAFTCWPLF